MQVRDILQQKAAGVVTIEASKAVGDAISLLNEHRIGALIVKDEGGEICGIISERDILRECGRRWTRLSGAGRGRASAPPLVRDLMTADLIIAVPDDDLNYVMSVMTRNRIRHLPILEGRALVGIISIGDVVKAFVEESAFENRMLKNYIHGAGP